MSIAVTTRTLDNGLDVIVHEDHHAPLVAVNVWYHVGSKNERPGRTGFAHLFEHLMFEGSAHQLRGFFEPLQEVGASLNGSTSSDRTNYWEVVPTSAASLALWMESDRMGWLLPAVTEARFQTQRDVVLNERRQNYENRPYGLAQFHISAALYPPDHPYHWPTIGDPDDLRAATLDDVHAFFKQFYHPGNASLAVAGDVRTDAVLAEIETHFGAIPAGPPVDAIVAPAARSTPVQLVQEDRVELSRIYLAWPSAALFTAGDAELDLVADILGNGRSSRLYKRLIHDERIAAELGATQSSRELTGVFQVVASAAPGHTLDEIAAIVHDEIRLFAEEGPTPEEVQRGRVHAEAAFTRRLETLGGFGGKADQLNAYNIHRGRPDWFDADLARYLRADAGALADATGRWLAGTPRVALSVVPTGRPGLALTDSEPVRGAV
ncbi:MAG TPA: pitrilysin family protein [Vicinamibacterales bacterium]|nr:pitrilysin family protein [Vicinamibacterales bacterium]